MQSEIGRPQTCPMHTKACMWRVRLTESMVPASGLCILRTRSFVPTTDRLYFVRPQRSIPLDPRDKGRGWMGSCAAGSSSLAAGHLLGCYIFGNQSGSMRSWWLRCCWWSMFPCGDKTVAARRPIRHQYAGHTGCSNCYRRHTAILSDHLHDLQ